MRDWLLNPIELSQSLLFIFPSTLTLQYNFVDELRSYAEVDGIKVDQVVCTIPSIIKQKELKESKELSKLINLKEIFLIRYSKLIQTHFGDESDEERKSHSRRLVGVALYWRVAATAITYFKRFYLNNSLLAFDPRIIMLVLLQNYWFN